MRGTAYLPHSLEHAAYIFKSDVIRFWSGNSLLTFDITVILGFRPHRVYDHIFQPPD
jgi:hypothetical protein